MLEKVLSRVDVRKLFLSIGFGIAIGLSSKLKIFLPYTPVPITLQTMFVILAGYFLGSGYGSLSAAFYVFFGLLGVDWFAYGGGFYAFFGPTGGYIFGFIISAYLVGFLSGFVKRYIELFGIFVLGIFVIYLTGALWFWGWTGFSIDFSSLLTKSILPFIFPDLIKVLVALYIVKMFNRFFH